MAQTGEQAKASLHKALADLSGQTHVAVSVETANGTRYPLSLTVSPGDHQGTVLLETTIDEAERMVLALFQGISRMGLDPKIEADSE